MKRLVALLLLGSIIAPQAALAHGAWRRHRHPHRHHHPRVLSVRQQLVGYEHNICYVEEVKEVYVPGTRYRRGYVSYERDIKEVPCRNTLDTNNIRPYDPNQPDYRPVGRVDDNSCIEGAVLGGILGGGAAALGSRGNGYAWSVPLGVVAGSLVGCQVDGG